MQVQVLSHYLSI